MVSLCACEQSEEPYVPTGDALVMEGEDIISNETEPEEEQQLVLVYNPEKSMNPLLSTDFTNRAIFSLIYQGLFAVDSDYNVEPMLCSGYRMSDDMRTYTFYIDNAFFSDGTKLTINDVLASYTAAQASTYFGGRFQHIIEYYLSADGGITFYLDTAYENFPILLDIPILKETELEAERPLGTGPYYLQEMLNGLYLRRNHSWWCKADMVATAPAITLKEGTDPAQIRDMFQFEDVSLVCADPSSENFADFRSDFELWDCDNGMFLYIGCNASTSEVFTNEKVRSALTYAIDREYLVNTFYQGFAHAATLPASPMSPYYSDQLAQRYDYDPGVFEAALESEGMLGKTVILLVNREDTLRMRVARALRDILTECGLKVQMKEYNRTDYLYSMGTRSYDLYLGQTKLSPNMDLTPFFKSGGTFRYGGMTDENMYQLCRDALANQGNYYNLHQTVADDGRLCPVLFHSYAIYAERGLLTQLTPARDNVFFYSIGKTMKDAFMFNE